jgi:hypothetical protein
MGESLPQQCFNVRKKRKRKMKKRGKKRKKGGKCMREYKIIVNMSKKCTILK